MLRSSWLLWGIFRPCRAFILRIRCIYHVRFYYGEDKGKEYGKGCITYGCLYFWYFIFYILYYCQLWDIVWLCGATHIQDGMIQRVRRLVTWIHTIASYYIIATADLDRFPGSIAELTNVYTTLDASTCCILQVYFIFLPHQQTHLQPQFNANAKWRHKAISLCPWTACKQVVCLGVWRWKVKPVPVAVFKRCGKLTRRTHILLLIKKTFESCDFLGPSTSTSGNNRQFFKRNLYKDREPTTAATTNNKIENSQKKKQQPKTKHKKEAAFCWCGQKWCTALPCMQSYGLCCFVFLFFFFNFFGFYFLARLPFLVCMRQGWFVLMHAALRQQRQQRNCWIVPILTHLAPYDYL